MKMSKDLNEHQKKNTSLAGVREKKRFKKTTTSSAPDFINLTVWSQDSSEVCFRINRTSKLQKLMTSYCQHKAVSSKHFRFLHNGRLVKGSQTVDQAGLEEGDKLDAMLEMSGGMGLEMSDN